MTRFGAIFIKNSVFSDWLNIPYEVPQGSLIVPLMSLVNINDLPVRVKFSESYLFAGDTTFACENKSFKLSLKILRVYVVK